jgi:hypothetical protein
MPKSDMADTEGDNVLSACKSTYGVAANIHLDTPGRSPVFDQCMGVVLRYALSCP